MCSEKGRYALSFFFCVRMSLGQNKACSKELLQSSVLHQLIFLIPGDEYVSNCFWPLRKRCSMVVKSFLLTLSCLRNSDLNLSMVSKSACNRTDMRAWIAAWYTPSKVLELIASVLSNSQYEYWGGYFFFPRKKADWQTCGFLRTSLRHWRYNDRTSRCKPDNRGISPGQIPGACLCCLFLWDRWLYKLGPWMVNWPELEKEANPVISKWRDRKEQKNVERDFVDARDLIIGWHHNPNPINLLLLWLVGRDGPGWSISSKLD